SVLRNPRRAISESAGLLIRGPPEEWPKRAIRPRPPPPVKTGPYCQIRRPGLSNRSLIIELDHGPHVRFGSEADMCAAKSHVRFTSDCDRKSRHRLIGRILLSLAIRGERSMQSDANLFIPTPKRAPWNKGRLVGAKPPLQQKHVWAIRGMLQNERNKRDLAMFDLAIDSKLRGCDVVTIKVDDVAPNGYAINRATVRQRKTRRPVRFELTEHTRQAVDDYLKFSREK